MAAPEGEGRLPGAHWTLRQLSKKKWYELPLHVIERHADRDAPRGVAGGLQTHSHLATRLTTGRPVPNEHPFSRELGAALAPLALFDVQPEFYVKSPRCGFGTPIDWIGYVYEPSTGRRRRVVGEVKTSFTGVWTNTVGVFHKSVKDALSAARIVPSACGYAMLQAMLGAIALAEQPGEVLGDMILIVARAYSGEHKVMTELRRLDMRNPLVMAAARAVIKRLSHPLARAASMKRYVAACTHTNDGQPEEKRDPPASAACTPANDGRPGGKRPRQSGLALPRGRGRRAPRRGALYGKVHVSSYRRPVPVHRAPRIGWRAPGA